MIHKPPFQDQLIHDNPNAQAPASRYAWLLLTIALWCALIGALVPSALDMAYAFADWVLSLERRDWVVFIASAGLIALGIRATRRRDHSSRLTAQGELNLGSIYSATDLQALRSAQRVVAHHDQRGHLSSVEIAQGQDLAVTAPRTQVKAAAEASAETVKAPVAKASDAVPPTVQQTARKRVRKPVPKREKARPVAPGTTKARTSATDKASALPVSEEWTLERVRAMLSKYQQPFVAKPGSGTAVRQAGGISSIARLKIKSIRHAPEFQVATADEKIAVREGEKTTEKLAEKPAGKSAVKPTLKPLRHERSTPLVEMEEQTSGSSRDDGHQTVLSPPAARPGGLPGGSSGMIMIQAPATLPWTNRPGTPARRPVKYFLLASALSLLLSFESAAAPGLAPPPPRQDQAAHIKPPDTGPSNARDPPFW